MWQQPNVFCPKFNLVNLLGRFFSVWDIRYKRESLKAVMQTLHYPVPTGVSPTFASDFAVSLELPAESRVLLAAAKNKPCHPPATFSHLGFGLWGFSRCILFFYDNLTGALHAHESYRIYNFKTKEKSKASMQHDDNFKHYWENKRYQKFFLWLKWKALRAGVCSSYERQSCSIWRSRGFLNRQLGGRPSSDGLVNANRESRSITPR